METRISKKMLHFCCTSDGILKTKMGRLPKGLTIPPRGVSRAKRRGREKHRESSARNAALPADNFVVNLRRR